MRRAYQATDADTAVAAAKRKRDRAQANWDYVREQALNPHRLGAILGAALGAGIGKVYLAREPTKASPARGGSYW